jgi:hypothetical protein
MAPGTNEALKDAVELARSAAESLHNQLLQTVHGSFAPVTFCRIVGLAGPTPDALRGYEQLRLRQVAPRHADSVAVFQGVCAEGRKWDGRAASQGGEKGAQAPCLPTKRQVWFEYPDSVFASFHRDVQEHASYCVSVHSRRGI